MTHADLVDVSTASVGLIVDVGGGIPVIVHWGAPMEVASENQIQHRLQAVGRPVPYGGLDTPPPLSVMPLHGEGTQARPGLLGHRHGGRNWAPRFLRHHVERSVLDDGTQIVRHVGMDTAAGLIVTTEIHMTPHGVMRLGASVTNDHPRRYMVHAVSLGVPVPAEATELLTLEGRWIREARIRRDPWTHGTRVIEHRGARPTQTRPPLLWAMTPGTGEWHGEVWAVHLAWSANHALAAEVLPDGRRHMQAGELLHPGEVCLEPGETYTTPWLLAMWSGEGMTPASWGFHREVRSRPHHPGPQTPRPVLISTWESGYFDQDPARLRHLADLAAQVGCERFVLDDGWFGDRRNDRRGLGDWTVATDVHPDGLEPLFDHVRARGMDVGLWVEPEMVNPDSDLYRQHPNWVLTTPGYEPVLSRHQLVLDLTQPEVWTYLFERLTSSVADVGVAWLKWDMNRDHVAASLAGGAAGTHAQTLAVHRLLAAFTERFPQLEIETCASGGGRADLAMLAHTVRVWASDCNDPVERQHIQRGWSLLLPPEVIGAHLGPPLAHTTGRRTSLGFRAITAMFGHLGVEWDLSTLTPEQLAEVAQCIAVHRRFRSLLHGGDGVRFDVDPEHPDQPTRLAYGVYSSDRREALLAWVQVTTSASLVPPPWRLPGLDPHQRYAVRSVALPGGAAGTAHDQPPWMNSEASPLILDGSELARWGLQPPVLWPESGILVHLEAVGDRGGA